MLGAILSLAFTQPAAPIEVEWTAPVGCPTQTQVKRQLSALLDRPDTPRGRARVVVRQTATGFVAQLDVRTETVAGVRTIEGDVCDSLARGVTLVIAVWVDPLGVSQTIAASERSGAPTEPVDEPVDELEPPGLIPEPDEPERAPTRPATESSTQARDSAEVFSEAPPPKRPPISLDAFTLGGVGLGLLPEVSAVVGGGVGLGLGQARLQISALHEPRRRVTHPDAPQSGAAVSLTAGRLSACWQPTAGRVIFPLCLGGQVGAVTAVGRGLSERRTARELWAAVSPQATVLFRPWWWFGIGAGVEAPISLLRPRFTIDDFEVPLLEVGAAGFRAAIVLDFTFFDETRRSRR